MSEPDAGLDARLRSLFADVVTSRDFDARVMRRIAMLESSPEIDPGALVECRRALARRRLDIEFWSNAVVIAGVGAAAGAILWRHAAFIRQWVQSGGLETIDPWLVAVAAIALLAGNAAVFLRGRAWP